MQVGQAQGKGRWAGRGAQAQHARLTVFWKSFSGIPLQMAPAVKAPLLMPATRVFSWITPSALSTWMTPA